MSVTYYFDSYNSVIELITGSVISLALFFLPKDSVLNMNLFNYFLFLCEKFHCSSDKINIETVDLFG